MPERTIQRSLGYALPATAVVALIVLSDSLSPLARFGGATVGLFLAIKSGSSLLVAARRAQPPLSPLQTVLFWLVWPGVRPDRFAGCGDDVDLGADTFVTGYAYLMVGLALMVTSMLVVPVVGMSVSTWLLLVAFLAAVHSGVGRLLPFGLRWFGLSIPRLFDDPLRSRSVAAFWSRRWNRPFIEMNRLFVTGPLASRVGTGAAAFAGFVVSGLLHELAISYPAGAGWGLPLIYFLVQAVAYTVETYLFPDTIATHPWAGRVWMILVVVGPMPLLFHAPFRMTFLAPLVEAGRSLLMAYPLSAYVSVGLWIGAAGHFLVLTASFQVPRELEWHSDLASLKPLNRKLLWTYGGYIAAMIVAFGVVTLVFHRQLVAGTPVALGLCMLIVLFWTARVLIDGFYFSQEDWPDGPEYVVGHTMLTSLFVALIAIYGGTFAAHVASVPI